MSDSKTDTLSLGCVHFLCPRLPHPTFKFNALLNRFLRSILPSGLFDACISMIMVGFCGPVRDARERAREKCFQLFPCLSDPGISFANHLFCILDSGFCFFWQMEQTLLMVWHLGVWVFSGRRASLCLKVALVVLHIVYVGVLFLFDGDMIAKTRKEPWYCFLFLDFVENDLLELTLLKLCRLYMLFVVFIFLIFLLNLQTSRWGRNRIQTCGFFFNYFIIFMGEKKRKEKRINGCPSCWINCKCSLHFILVKLWFVEFWFTISSAFQFLFAGYKD